MVSALDTPGLVFKNEIDSVLASGWQHEYNSLKLLDVQAFVTPDSSRHLATALA